MVERRRLQIMGLVQGVGFRPFAFNLAHRLGVVGWVLNDADGVIIEAEGTTDQLDAFIRALQHEAPPLARIAQLTQTPLTPQGARTFQIEHSLNHAHKQAWIASDVAVCAACLRELFDPHNRRYRYPFINCTNCGPRFTIVRGVPYDRPLTTMASFAMCGECQREYDDPSNRRFHAQPNACPRCGPMISIQHPISSTPYSAASSPQNCGGYAAIEAAAQLLCDGKIVAIKGLGGYHLACDALNADAVARLRERKHRYHKPFALMVADLEAARALCEANDAEAQWLTSHHRPIMLLRERAPRRVAAQVAPRQKQLGVMLPYTPLHHLLFDACAQRASEQAMVALVMTSGNLSDEPIAYDDDEARERLSSIADAFLTHNRAIYTRCDDSVARMTNDQLHFLRRSRGYAPEPLRVAQPFHVPILAVGAHLKNTFCLAKDNNAFISHHIGDLENYETLKSFTEGIEHYKCLFDIAPRIIAHDLHPEYLSTQYALEQSAICNLPSAIPVQHHHAHIAAVMGEHGVTTPVIGVAFDGTGYGADGTLWGGEFLLADYARCERVAHFGLLPLIGGERAIHEVWRLAAAWLQQVYSDDFLQLDLAFVRRLDPAKWRAMRQMLAHNINAPQSSAVGRWFDAVAALIGVCAVARYEAQAAIELEQCVDESCDALYPLTLGETTPHVLKTDALLQAIVADLQRQITPSVIAAKFHNTLAHATTQVCERIRRERGVAQVALGGGVFQNARLLQQTTRLLRERGFVVYVPTQLPPNDGSIAFGQALVANARMVTET